MKFCNQCGQGNQDDAAFCVLCGKAFEAIGSESPPAGGGETPPVGGDLAAPPPAGPQPPPPPGQAWVTPGPPPGPTGMPPPGPPVMPPPGYVPVARRDREVMAVAALIMGIAGFFFMPLILGPLAVIFGYIGRRRIAASNGALEGDSFCTAGIILGFIQIGIVVYIGIILIIAIIAWTHTNAMAPALISMGILSCFGLENRLRL